MTLFRKEDQLVVDLTTEAYARWLRAQRPDLTFFLGLPEAEQEALAALGDEYVSDLCVALGHAVRDPVAAEARLGSPEAEGDLLSAVAGMTLERIEARDKRAPALSTGGFGQRKAAAEAARPKRGFLGADA